MIMKELTKEQHVLLSCVQRACTEDFQFIEHVINAATNGVLAYARERTVSANMSETKCHIALYLLITKFMRKKSRIENMQWITNAIAGKPSCGVEKNFLAYFDEYKKKHGGQGD